MKKLKDKKDKVGKKEFDEFIKSLKKFKPSDVHILIEDRLDPETCTNEQLLESYKRLLMS